MWILSIGLGGKSILPTDLKKRILSKECGENGNISTNDHGKKS